ncbi:hypothetical protein AS888_20695 [Peribacillus simplex]|uniref:Uncharacterized protein n=1 Tax=Peribacillus simplex TaxID=1478 RepID=A0A120GPE3_9BACI|nr:hypothetical protein AS888_20695 [Peribacillus simplex]
MDIYKHKGHTVYKLAKKILFFKQHEKVMFWHEGKVVKNHRFSIRPNRKWCYFHWFIRQPYFYFERNNGGLYIGTPNKYFHIQKRYR